MKYIKVLYYLILILLSSCLETLEDSSENFVKVYGELGTSTGEKIVPLSDGNFLILGRIGKPAFNLPSNVDNVFDFGLGAILIDKNGNKLKERIYPVDSIFTGEIVQYRDLESKGIIQWGVECADGGILFAGEWRNGDVYFSAPEVGVDFYLEDPGGGLPFLGKFDADLNLLFIDPINNIENVTPEQRLKATPVLKRLSNNQIYLMLGFHNSLEFNLDGYSLLELDENGKIIRSFTDLRPVREPGDDLWLKFTRDFDLDENGDIVLIGQRKDNIAVFKVPVATLDSETNFNAFAPEGENGFNRNPKYIRSDNIGGYIVVYTDPPNEIIVRTLSGDFIPNNTPVDITDSSKNEYPREFIHAKNGDYLLLAEKLVAGDNTVSYIYRLDPQGKVIFKKRFSGSAGDIIETEDGSIMLMTNPIYNEQLNKITISKLDANGNFN